MTTHEAIDHIIRLNSGLRDFWSTAHGWAPDPAAQMLSRSRLDWQVELSMCLKLWVDGGGHNRSNGALILAWTNLGALLEGTLKLFLSVYYTDYHNDPGKIVFKKKTVDTDIIKLDSLKNFFTKKNLLNKKSLDLIGCVQVKRNAIHAFQARPIGNFIEYEEALIDYLFLIRDVNLRLPYPDDIYVPLE